MKKASLILSIAAMAGAAVLTTNCANNKSAQEAVATTDSVKAEAGAIVYFQIDRVLEEYDMANDLQSVVETKIQNIQAAVTSRQNKLEKDYNAFNEKINKGLMTRSVAEAQAQKLEQQKAEFEQYAGQKQQEIYEEQQVMMNQLSDAIKTFIDNFNAEMGYAMIIANQGGNPIIVADPDLDITDAIIAGLNEEYVKSKNSKKE